MSKQSNLIRFYTNLNDTLLQCTNEVLMLIFTTESVLSVRCLKMLRICMESECTSVCGVSKCTSVGSVPLFVKFLSVMFTTESVLSVKCLKMLRICMGECTPVCGVSKCCRCLV